MFSKKLSCKTTGSSDWEGELLQNLKPGQRCCLKRIMDVYDSKPEWEKLKRQYALSLFYKYFLGYVPKDKVASYVPLIKNYCKKVPTKQKNKEPKTWKTSSSFPSYRSPTPSYTSSSPSYPGTSNSIPRRNLTSSYPSYCSRCR
ncbi:protein FAM216B [Gracilinanus agilis]|uniref:protein FAM216B n=1 Tax=Gracilinanus agilis TaxID=191870 RepID=UPI001CFD5C80|nr:protein FAM216B [Gracilinanus agilis]